MALRKYKPVTAGTRWRIGNAYAEITTDQPEKSACWKKSTAQVAVIPRDEGRCVISVAVIRSITALSISREIKKIFLGTVVSIEYDPNRTAFIALIQYSDGEKRYILAPQGLAGRWNRSGR